MIDVGMRSRPFPESTDGKPRKGGIGDDRVCIEPAPDTELTFPMGDDGEGETIDPSESGLL